MIKEILYLIMVGSGVGILAYLYFRKNSKDKPCSVCRVPAHYGYSKKAEDIENIEPMCRDCLITQLMKDYKKFDGKAVVVQPASGPPVYVYQSLVEWKEAFPSSLIAEDVSQLLHNLKDSCQLCGVTAKYLWIESRGLNGENFSDTLDKGLSEILLIQNPKPKTLCAECCVKRIKKELQKDIRYLEVCAPHGSAKGFVVPMGY